MEWLNIILVLAGAVVIIYTSIQFFKFSFLQKKLYQKNLKGYKKILGEDYRSRAVDMKIRRYKWEKGIFIVRAHFDDEGNLIGRQNIRTRFSRKKKEITWN